MPKFIICVYNKKVRSLKERGLSSTFYADTWAENNYVEITSRDSSSARAEASMNFPEREGFVIVDITQLAEYD